jgi:type II secretory pathway component PulL
MIETRMLGPKNDQWAVINLGSQWLATTRAVYADAVKDAIADAIAKQSNPSL